VKGETLVDRFAYEHDRVQAKIQQTIEQDVANIQHLVTADPPSTLQDWR
jgi:hypothetical protein